MYDFIIELRYLEYLPVIFEVIYILVLNSKKSPLRPPHDVDDSWKKALQVIGCELWDDPVKPHEKVCECSEIVEPFRVQQFLTEGPGTPLC